MAFGPQCAAAKGTKGASAPTAPTAVNGAKGAVNGAKGACTFSGKIALGGLPLKLFDPSTGAICLDGSTGGYHARQGSKTQLMISLPGGGWCWNTPTCTERSNTPLGSMDAFIKERGMTRTVGEGELNGLPSLNPHFFNFSMLSPVYCDGSNFAGARDHDNVTKPGGGTMTLRVRGRAILEAALDVALEEWGLKDTVEEVMLTGCSAGGTATYFNVDFVHTWRRS